MKYILMDWYKIDDSRENVVTRRRRRPTVERTGDDRVHIASSSPRVGDSWSVRVVGGVRGVFCFDLILYLIACVV
jgi:hypothetical protein